MALAQQHTAHRIFGQAQSPFTLELYLDYVCPFSAKIWKQLRSTVIPWLEEKHPEAVQIIFRHQIQPWHPSSILTAEAALAVEEIDPSAFVAYSDLLFSQQQLFFDEAVVDQTRQQTYDQLAALALLLPSNLAKVPLVQLQEQVLEKTRIQPSSVSGQTAGNHGNKVTDNLKKWIKLGRQTGIHVSPTVLWNGLVENAISSGWTLTQWSEYLEKSLQV